MSAFHDVTGLPKRTRDQLDRMAAAFDAVDGLLHRLALQGLQRMSNSSADELGALAKTAHGAGLIRVERELDRLTTLTARALGRDPLFDMEAWQATLNRVWLINNRARARFEAGELPAQMGDLIGVARRSYTMVPGWLDLTALGADGWVSDSGFLGVTVYYADLAGRLYQGVCARPVMHFGTDPARMMWWGVHDDLDQTLAEVSHGAWRFEYAKVSADDRLSFHRDLRLTPAAWLGARAYDGVRCDQWSDIVSRLRAADVTPVGGDAPPLCFIEPHAVSPVTVDQTRARAWATARDATGATLDIEVPLRRENNLLIDNLERMYGPRDDRAPRCNGLLGQVSVAGDRLLFAPITGVWHHPLRLRGRRRGAHHTAHLSLESLEGARRA